ncbi:elongation factor 4 [bacterium (Candidatus Gribaldobacteria) CG10_big_fil_rev_8_21_14_0_10_37_21]|uniref:Elongation factor 4 n=1 Tax=bacterium (Candidatus Gribaldobacteria) CG10_big_fil_rev_8_21_14_0_10_37_21 TaxID=2014275 RepID=A0A2H0UUD8_9BACT|nr:MAG: elongation factor 4 [Parcubacteria group bacterium CG1_02_37_13]PIR90476.1 MAG: elongation factor 4 [bacterium (Candidatus Gribaldobacteria) CG10_big_fil_rev_8_21_14_0_10_37_21]
MLEKPKIINFCIIAHIDHGKSTLADRLLELTHTIEKGKLKEQFLDSMDLEREKGITIKMHPCRMLYHPPNIRPISPISPMGPIILNLIDTPGHIDFSYEISRALACCEGALLLVDATKGVQAQTIFNYENAKKQGLKILAAINKVDVATPDQIKETKKELAVLVGLPENEIMEVSGKTGLGVEELLERIVQEVPEAKEESEAPLQALVFDSKYDSFSGVVAYVRVFQGRVKRGDKLLLMVENKECQIKEVGYFTPTLKASEELKAGEVGYLKTGIKEPGKVKVGDTITIANSKRQMANIKNSQEKTAPESSQSFSRCVSPLPGYKEPQPVLYLSLYPASADNFDLLKEGLLKLKLNDPALKFEIESKMALGRGFRIGFLGTLHAEITIKRLEAEYGMDLAATSPQVVFEVHLKNGAKSLISSPANWPEPANILTTKEPFVEMEIICPNQYYSPVFKCLQSFEAILTQTKAFTENKSLFIALAPLREIISGNFYEALKNVSSGFASFSFKEAGFESAKLVKVDIFIAGNKEDAFSRILPEYKAFTESKKFLGKLKDILPVQQFSVALQATISGKIIARETLKSFRKDVTSSLYGGDVTRKRKVLERQKKGKKELKSKGKVSIPATSFLEALR